MKVLDWLEGRDAGEERALAALERIAVALERIVAETFDPWAKAAAEAALIELDAGAKTEDDEAGVSWPLERDEPELELSHPERTFDVEPRRPAR